MQGLDGARAGAMGFAALVIAATMACGGRTQNASGGQAGGNAQSEPTSTMKALCAEVAASDCGLDAAQCESNFVSERETAALHGCADTYDQLVECHRTHGFYCARALLYWETGCEALGSAVTACE